MIKKYFKNIKLFSLSLLLGLIATSLYISPTIASEISVRILSSTTTIRLVLSVSGTYGTADGNTKQPTGVAVDGSGNIFVADKNNHRIQKFNSSGTYQAKTTGTTASTADGRFNYPYGVAVDGSGNVYVADGNNHRIQKLNSSLAYVWKVGGTTSGTGDYQFNTPQDIILDNDGNLLVADTSNHRIMKFDTSGTFILKFGTNGTGNGELSSPIGIAVDASNNIYVADSGNNRIQKFSSTGTFISILPISQGDGLTQVYTPRGVAVGSDGDIYVTDSYSSYIKRFRADGTYVYSYSVPTPWHVVVSGSNFYVGSGANPPYIRKFDSGGTVYQVNNLPATVDVINTADGLSLKGSGIYGASGAAIAVRLKDDSGPYISDVTVNMTADRDWTSVTADSDRAAGKSVVANLIGAPGAGATHTLYVPIPNGKGSNTVFICPTATTLSAVNLSCSGGVSRAAGSYVESFGNITVSKVSNLGDSIEYWKIEGMTGSGGLVELVEYSGSGLGTEGDPYQITTCSEFQEMKDNRDAYYQIMNDIDCSATTGWNGGNGFITIGTSAQPFFGSLTGGSSYEVSSLFMVVLGSYSGVFGYTENATFNEVHLTNIDITKGDDTYDYVGGLVGFMEGGTITNSSVTGSIEQTAATGFLNYYFGGMIGMLEGGTVTDSYTDVNFTYTGYGAQFFGGFVGGTRGTSLIEDSYALGDLTIGWQAYDIGGFIGDGMGNTTINRSYSSGYIHTGNGVTGVQGDNYDIGGFAGGLGGDSIYPGSLSINSSYSTSEILNDGEDNYDTGGFAGRIDTGAEVNYSYSSGDVEVSGYSGEGTGGFVGLMRNNTSGTDPIVRYSKAQGAIQTGKAPYQVGGFVGELRDGSIIYGYETGNLSIQKAGDEAEVAVAVGGFVGGMTSATITDSFAIGNITSVGLAKRLGGFLGYGMGAINVNRTAALGNVQGNDIAGGHSGYLVDSGVSNPSVSNSRAKGNVTIDYANAAAVIGGFVGYADSAQLTNTYSEGDLTYDVLTVNKGGYIGDNNAGDPSTITSSYWDMETSGEATSDGGTGHTTAQMKVKENFVGWDFPGTWNTHASKNNGKPFLNIEKVALEGIGLDIGTIDPVFDSYVYDYTLDTTESEIKFTIDFDNLLITSVTVNGTTVEDGVESVAFPLVEGVNNFDIVVNSTVVLGVNDTATYTYNVDVTKATTPELPPDEEPEGEPEGRVIVLDEVVPGDDDGAEVPDIPDQDITPPIVPVIPKEEPKKTPVPFNHEAAVSSLFIGLIILEGIATQVGIMRGNIWYAFVALLDRMKKRRPWGVVYDSIEKKNLSRAILRLMDLNSGKLLDTVVTDSLGIFKLGLNKGSYKILATVVGYIFPSKVVFTDQDGNYSNVYRGGGIRVVSPVESMMISIPVDPQENDEMKSFLKTLVNLFEKFVAIISPLIFTFGLGYAIYAYKMSNTNWNIFVIAMYAVVLLSKIIILLAREKPFGRVVDSRGAPVVGLQLGLFDAEFNKQAGTTTTNEKGKYNFVIQNNDYYIKSLDPKYTLQGGQFNIKKQKNAKVLLINEKIVVDY